MITTLDNGNVYIEAFSQLGQVDEVTLPDPTSKDATINRLGMIGELDVSTGKLEKMEMEIKWGGINPETAILMGDPSVYRSLQIRSSVKQWGAGGKELEVPAIVFCRARFKNFPLGAIKSGELTQFTSKLAVSAIKLIVAGVTLYEVDVINNVWSVGGVDLLALTRLNIGG